MLFITLTYHNNLLKKMNNNDDYNSEKNSDIENNFELSDDNYFLNSEEIIKEMNWLRTMIINEQEFKIHDMRHEIFRNTAIKTFVNTHNEISEQMNTVNKTA